MNGFGDNQATSIAIDIEESWVESMKSKLNGSFVRQWRTERCSIFRVPPNLRACDPDAYEPRVVSIGPYHRGDARLQPMENHKWRTARRLLARCLDEDNLFRECLRRVKAQEERARSCYSEVIAMESNEFVEMMFLDGCFIIGILLREKSDAVRRRTLNKKDSTTMERWKDGEGVNADDEWAWREWNEEEPERSGSHNSLYLIELVDHDLLKVENQIPFFVIETLYEVLAPHKSNGDGVASVYELAMNLLNKIDPSDYYATIENPEVHHLLHLFYVLLVPDHSRKSFPIRVSKKVLESKVVQKVEDVLRPISRAMSSFIAKDSVGESQRHWNSGWIRSATELREAGVKFVEKERCSFLDVSFRDGVMEIPVLCIFEHTIVLLRNLIAFEQCYLHTKDHITFYAVLMDCLIDTPGDVKVLQKKGILRIGLSSEGEVARFFNRLCKEVFYANSQSYLRDLFVDVNRYCDSKTHRWRAVLARDYFNSPWAVVSFVAAVILLVLTFLQTFYSVFGYYHHK
ncbi:UPF0481 protein [Acorus calamus]|uniref:UPF0481 protein n=1 Tax=Acorus calamus TaxID=4465 RepID=A0AAV9FJL5_ACOCL|nr:UPF0481 protein [Acorus calamus]